MLILCLGVILGGFHITIYPFLKKTLFPFIIENKL